MSYSSTRIKAKKLTTTHRFFAAPPVHLVPAGNVTETASVPVPLGAYTWHCVSLKTIVFQQVRTYPGTILGYSCSDKAFPSSSSINSSSDLSGTIDAPTITSASVLPIFSRHSYPLKLITFTVNAFPFALTAEEDLKACAMFTPAPHGALALGLLVFARTGVPVTPSAGEMAACAFAWKKREKRTREAVMKRANMLDKWYQGDLLKK